MYVYNINQRSDHIKPLSHLQPAIQVEKQKIHIDPTILFSRLIAIVEREEDTKLYFDYELSSFPTSLFKDGFMRKGVKSQLAKNETYHSIAMQYVSYAF